ncbi:hypothetical protein WV31_12605 [Magnetospirillum sp. ME-1]|uniref:cadherin-like domain-containing protein n=1 Tax=Magnetospirillum sp. ME-1 TaxID=1639348 RepID=UPI000A17ECFE|nr:cadherin-like domain-containing protein [Magnetospirillum sp. ME-1]ARJ66447.1 hypothetical protein WV31_12605 [Magnetospirillum sp. ME-1]
MTLPGSTAGSTITILKSDLLANASDPDHDVLSIRLGSVSATHGTVTETATTVVFTPTTGYSGPATLSYTIVDGRGGQVTASATTTVSAPSHGLLAEVASNPVVNGDFETGTFTGWVASLSPTVANGGSPLTNWMVYPASSLNGSHVALNGFDGGVLDGNGAILYETPLYFHLQQPITLTGAPVHASLSFSFKVSGGPSFSVARDGQPTADRVFTVHVTDGSGDVIPTVYTYTVPGTTVDAGAVHNVNIDLSSQMAALSPGTYTLDLQELVPQYYTGPAEIQLDNIALKLSQGLASASEAVSADQAVSGWILGLPATTASSDTVSFHIIDGSGNPQSSLATTHGTASIDAITGKWIFTPLATLAANLSVTDTFVVGVVDDQTGQVAQATIQVNISSPVTSSGAIAHITSASTVVDANFSGLSGVSTLEINTGSAALNLTLGSAATAAGIGVVDGSQATGNIMANASAYSTGLDITTGSGNDTITSSSGNDTIAGGLGSNIVDAGTGTDTVDYGAAVSAITATIGSGSATVVHSGGTDTLTGVEIIQGSTFGDTFMVGVASTGTILGGGGADMLDITALPTGNLALDGAGASESIRFDIAGRHMESLVRDLSLNGSDLVAVLDGGGTLSIASVTTDTIIDPAGDTHRIVGQGGATTAGTDYVVVGTASDTSLTGNTGDDLLIWHSGNTSLVGGGGHDLADFRHAAGAIVADMYGGTSAVIGGSTTVGLFGISEILGGNSADTLTAGTGEWMLAGGDGNNVMDGSHGTTTVSYQDQVTGVTIDLAGGTATHGAYTDTLTGMSGAVGSDFADTIIGGTGAEYLDGGFGANTVTGGSGVDTFVLHSSTGATATQTVTDFAGDQFSLSDREFGLGNSGTLAAANYAEGTATVSGAAQDFGNANAGIVAIQNGANVEVWHTTNMDAATSSNSHLVGTLENINTSALDNTNFHLAI